MNILIIGSGGREHAIAWKIKQSPRLGRLYIAPGNAGTAGLGENLDIAVTDFQGLKTAAMDKNINLVVVGPEVPLVEGLTDFFMSDPALRKMLVVGPGKAGARLEGSKDFAKAFMHRHNIPTARHLTVTIDNIEDGHRFIDSLKGPYVLKADGLAAGKGVIIVSERQQAQNALLEMLNGQFGEASHRVVIEEFLEGIELSVFIATDGNSYCLLPEAKDYKRIGEGDTGPNTGGMGAISPVSFADDLFMRKVETRIIKPTVEGLRKEDIPYRGFIFFGLINCNGNPYVIEYNVRMGDPETEAVIPRIKSDIVDLLEATASGTVDAHKVEFDDRTVAAVMLVSGGYPGSCKKGILISGIRSAKNSMLFHAGTKQTPAGVVTDGGRVIAVSAYGRDMGEALAAAYATTKKLGFEGMYYRKDIGFDL